ncbi:MAG: AraC family transcriptional regulator [bacterium]|nr:AraC family transcriptional regulator [bacterium]
MKLSRKHFKKCLDIYVFKQKQSYLRLHAHDFVELVYILKGKGINVIQMQGKNKESQNVEFSVAMGDFFVVTPEQAHGYKNADDLELANILIDSSVFKNEIGSKLKDIDSFNDLFYIEPFYRKEMNFKYKLHLTGEQSRFIETILNKAINEIEKESEGYNLLVKGYIFELVVNVCRFYSEYQRQKDIYNDISTKRETCFRVIRYVEDNYDKDIRLKDLADIGYLQTNYFCKVFKDISGMTPMEYVTNYRIQKACDLLSNTDKSVTDVCFEVGFHDASYFARMFKELIKTSPSEYRKF